jgi:hypothetical protein
VKVFLQITAVNGTLSGYFGPDDLIQQALTVFTRTVLTKKRRKHRIYRSPVGTGFQAADILTGTPRSCPVQGYAGSPDSIRHVMMFSSPARDFAPVLPVIRIWGKEFDLRVLGPFPGVTVIECEVLITVFQEEEPETIGLILRNLAEGSEGVIVIGKEWKKPLIELESWFDRVGLVCEQPPESRGDLKTAGYSQTLIH